MATLEQNINQAISDFASIKNAIIKKVWRFLQVLLRASMLVEF